VAAASPPICNRQLAPSTFFRDVGKVVAHKKASFGVIAVWKYETGVS